jgi:RNA polymerase sigma-70 factor (ECF subfamily)
MCPWRLHSPFGSGPVSDRGTQSVSERGPIEIWIADAKGGSRSALAKLLAMHDPALRSRAEARMDPAIKAKVSADDILQEVYIDVARRIDRFEDRGPGSFLNWLHGILSQKLIDAHRAAHRKIRDINREVVVGGFAADSYWNLLEQLYTESGTPSRMVRKEEALGALMSSLSGLSEAHQQVLRLRYLEGLSVTETAQQMGRTEAAVRGLTERATEALRKAMERLGDFTHGG